MLDQPPQSRLRQRRRLPLAVDPSAPQRLVRIDVADARDEPLIQQAPLDRRMPRLQPRDDRSLVESRLEGVGRDVGDALGDAPRARLPRDVRDREIRDTDVCHPGTSHPDVRDQIGKSHAAEGALVDEAQLRSVISEVERGVQVGLTRRGRRLDEELATHTQMDDEALPMTIRCLEHQPEVLAPTLSGMNHVAAQAICQIDRPGQMTAGNTPTDEQGLSRCGGRQRGPRVHDERPRPLEAQAS